MSVIRSRRSIVLWSPRWLIESARRRLEHRAVWTLLVALVTVLAVRTLWPTRVVREDGRSAVAALVAPASTDDSQALSGGAAARFCLLLLEQSERTLGDARDMQAVFHKRERVDGELQYLNTMDLKVRRAPLSIYMRWHEPYAGREIIWQEGKHDDLILVHAGGWQRKLMPLLKIDPNGERALEYNRRPVTQIGLWNFNARLLKNLRNDLTRSDVQVSMTQGEKISGRDCFAFRVHHPARVEGLTYQRLHVFIDEALALPIACEIYGWSTSADGTDAPLEESYAFADLAINVGLADADFDEKNPQYQFGVH